MADKKVNDLLCLVIAEVEKWAQDRQDSDDPLPYSMYDIEWEMSALRDMAKSKTKRRMLSLIMENKADATLAGYYGLRTFKCIELFFQQELEKEAEKMLLT